MTSIFRMLFAIPRAIVRLVWRLFWGIVKTAIVLGVILFAINFYAEHSNSALAQSIFQIRETVSNFFSSTSASELKQTLSHLSTDDL